MSDPVGFGVGVGGNLLASLMWHYIEPVITRRAAKNLINTVVRESLWSVVEDLLCAWGEWYRLKGDLTNARRSLEEALAVAERCEYRLSCADVHNSIAQLEIDCKDLGSPQKQAQAAHDLALCDAPTHSYVAGLARARHLIANVAPDLRPT